MKSFLSPFSAFLQRKTLLTHVLRRQSVEGTSRNWGFYPSSHLFYQSYFCSHHVEKTSVSSTLIGAFFVFSFVYVIMGLRFLNFSFHLNIQAVCLVCLCCCLLICFESNLDIVGRDQEDMNVNYYESKSGWSGQKGAHQKRKKDHAVTEGLNQRLQVSGLGTGSWKLKQEWEQLKF